MQIIEKKLNGLYDIFIEPVVDHRGFLAKSFDQTLFKAAGIDVTWQQILFQHTNRQNTVKGLHIQSGEFAEAKLITPLEGEVLWVCVDLRLGSPTFLRHEKSLLKPGGPALYAARGFCHGCLHLTDSTLLMISADNQYSEAHGVGISWNDPDIGIEWPLIEGMPVIMKDEHRDNPPFAEVRSRLGV